MSGPPYLYALIHEMTLPILAKSPGRRILILNYHLKVTRVFEFKVDKFMLNIY